MLEPLRHWLGNHFGRASGQPENAATAKTPKSDFKNNLLNSTSPQAASAGTVQSTWKLMKPYWGTKEGKKGWMYLSAVLALTVAVAMPSIDISGYNINTSLNLNENNNIDIRTVEDQAQPPAAKTDPSKIEKHLDIHAKAFGQEYKWDMKEISSLGVIFANLNSEFVGNIIGAGTIAHDSIKNPSRYPDGFRNSEEYKANVQGAADTMKLWTFVTALLIGATVYSSYLRQKLHLDWRKSMTGHFVDKYFQDHSYYRLQSIYGSTDNPEQRIQQDIDQFTENTTAIPLGILQSGMMIAAFSNILLDMSEKVKIDIGPVQFQGHGYFLWASMSLAAIAGLSAYALGRPIIKQTQKQEMLEADFRYAAGRVRDNAESIAFLGGEGIEKKNLMEKFKPVAENWYKIMKTNKRLGWLQQYYGTAGDMIPFVFIAPAFMTGSISYAEFNLARSGFSRVDAGLSWFTNSFQALASWKATQNRLSTHDNAVDKSIAEAQYSNIIEASAADDKAAINAPKPG